MTPDARTDIAKLIPLLGSTMDGEVLAAARAISRKLEARGRTLHDLAALVGGGAQSAPPPRPAAWPSDASQSPGSLNPIVARTLARQIRSSDRTVLLSAWEQGQLDMIVTRLDAGLALTRAAETLLRDLHAKTTMRGRA